MARQAQKQMWGIDLSETSDAEVIDSPLIFAFPNCVLWGGYAVPWIYRFRPNGNDPTSAIMEVIQMTPVGEGHSRDHVPCRELGPDEPFSSAQELSYLGPVLDQDYENMVRQQIGLRSTPETKLRNTRYMESLIRHHHHVLDKLMSTD